MTRKLKQPPFLKEGLDDDSTAPSIFGLALLRLFSCATLVLVIPRTVSLIRCQQHAITLYRTVLSIVSSEEVITMVNDRFQFSAQVFRTNGD